MANPNTQPLIDPILAGRATAVGGRLQGAHHDDQPVLAVGANRLVPGTTLPGAAGLAGAANAAKPAGRARPQF